MTDAESLPRNLLRLFDGMPEVELIGIAGESLVSPKRLAELRPDLLLLNIERRQKEATKLFEYFSEQLPHCKTIVFSKQALPESTIDSFMQQVRVASDSSNALEKKVLDPATSHSEIVHVLDTSGSRQFAERRPQEHGHSTGMAINIASHCATEPGPARFQSMTWRSVDRRKTQGERRQSEWNRAASEQFQSFVEQLPGLPYIARPDAEARILYISHRISEFVGFTSEQWCNDPTLRLKQLHAEDRDTVRQAIQQAVDTKQGYSIDYRIHASDGSVRWFHDEARVMMDNAGTPLFLQGVVLDITERRHAQEELEKSHRELQELIVALDSLRAEEQKRLAHEMHDDLGQLLAAMKLDICTLQQRLPPENAEASKYLNSINELVDTMVISVRRIIADLPPKIVEDLGLLPALQSLTKSFQQRHHLECAIQVSDAPPALPLRMSTALYRIVQEALNNVVKHANATSVKIALHSCSTGLALQISDNGKGLPPKGTRKPGAFGLIGMRERTLALGGEIEIESREGEGTIVRIAIPLVT